EMDNPFGAAWSSTNLADISLAEGDLEAAREDYLRSLRLFHEHGAPAGIVECLRGLAQVAAAHPEDAETARHAARLFAALHCLKEETGIRLLPPESASHDRSVAAVTAALGERQFAAAWAEGAALPLEGAIALALETGAGRRQAP